MSRFQGLVVGTAIGVIIGLMALTIFSPARASGTTCDTLEIRKLDEIMNMVSGIQSDVEIGFGFNKREE